ncbi:MAG: hypothetical protein LBD52_06475 [Prevotellaceae bacterium]|nr:hypothetical protein [Prevotellaceae bacterium]
MKNIIKTGIILLTIAAMNVFIACEKEVVRDPSPEANPNSNRVYFNDIVKSVVLGIEENSYPITIARKDSNNALTVALTISGDKAFSIPPSVSFNAGESSTTFTLSIGDIELLKNYQVTLGIDENQINPYDSTAPVYSLNIQKEDFAPYAEGTYTSVFFGAYWTALLEYSPATDLYRFTDCWMPGYNVLFKWKGTAVTMQGTKNSSGSYIYLPTGYIHPSNGMIYAYYSQANINYYDEAAKTFTFPITWVVAAGSFGEVSDTFKIETVY